MTLKSDFPDVFKKELGFLQGIKAVIDLKEGSKPVPLHSASKLSKLFTRKHLMENWNLLTEVIGLPQLWW